MSSSDMSVGIDLGGDRLRVAARKDGTTTVLDHSQSGSLIRVLQFNSQKGRGVPKVAISSLKRLLDFETDVPVPPTGKNSVDCLSDILSGMRTECGLSERSACVLAVPPCFSQRQRSALRTAAAQGGFSDVRLVDELLAALTACEGDIADARNALVFAWGASVFSVGLYNRQKKHYKAVAQEGDRNLGGDDIDSAIASEALARMAADGLPPDVLRDHVFISTLVEESQKAKEELCRGEPAVLQILRERQNNWLPFFPSGATMVEIEPELCAGQVTEMIHRTLELVDTVLKDGECPDPDAVVLVGGLARLPALKQTMEKRFSCTLVTADDSAIAVGSVMIASALGTKAAKQQDDEAPATGAAPAAPAAEKPPQRVGEPVREGRGDVPRAGGGTWAKNFVPLIDLAEAHESSGRLPEAIDAFEKLLSELATFGGQLYRTLAARLVDEGNYEVAFDLLRRANRRTPNSSPVAVDLARVAIKEGGRFYDDAMRRGRRQATRQAGVRSALTMAEAGIEALEGSGAGRAEYAPHLGHLYHLKCLCLAAMGRAEEALEASEACLRCRPDDESFRKTAAQLREEIGNLKEEREAREKRGRRAASAASQKKPGRNSPCPCGSGRKFKTCCGKKK